MTPQELLNKAADDMAKSGHYKGKYYDHTWADTMEAAPVCAYGAMTRAAGLPLNWAGGFESHPLIRQAAHLLAQAIDPKQVDDNGSYYWDFGVITEYNDDKERTGAEVVRKMKEAASMADIGEDSPKIVEFEPMPETAPAPAPTPAPAPSEPVPA